MKLVRQFGLMICCGFLNLSSGIAMDETGDVYDQMEIGREKVIPINSGSLRDLSTEELKDEIGDIEGVQGVESN